jgi:hypothetical protein
LTIRKPRNIQEADDPDVEEYGDAAPVEKSEKIHSKQKPTVSAISPATPDGTATVTKDASENDEGRRTNPYRDPKNRGLFYEICAFYLCFEVVSGVTTGLSPYFIIVWAGSKFATYLSQIITRIRRLIFLHAIVHDLTRFADIDSHKDEPESPSPQEALESLLLMITEPKPNSPKGGNETQQTRKPKFEENDIRSMERLLKSLRGKAKVDKGDGRAVENTSTSQNRGIPQDDPLSTAQEGSQVIATQSPTHELEIQRDFGVTNQ